MKLPRYPTAQVTDNKSLVRFGPHRRRNAASPRGAGSSVSRDASGGRWTDELVHQRFERSGEIVMHARVHRGGLDDRAPRRDEPVEARALREGADRAGIGAAGADLRDHLEVAFDQGEVDAGG